MKSVLNGFTMLPSFEGWSCGAPMSERALI